MTRAWNRAFPFAGVAFLTLMETTASAQPGAPLAPLPPLPGLAAASTAAPPAAPPPAPPPPAPPAGGGSIAIEPSLPQLPGAPEAATPSSCVRDKDCPGDLECRQARCVPPGPRTGEPPPPPAPQVIYVLPPPELISPRGMSIGLRFGVGFPTGTLNSSSLLSDLVGVLFVGTLDVGYRLSPQWYVGGYVSAGYGTGSNCAEGGTSVATCYETDVRLGGDVQYSFLPNRSFHPWVGVGAGWEVLNEINTTDDGTDGESSSINGVEFAHVDVGVDFRVGARERLGPYLMATFADYDDSAVHEWIILGMRTRFDTDWLGSGRAAR